MCTIAEPHTPSTLDLLQVDCDEVLFESLHLHISHNTPLFLLGVATVPREIENNAYAKFWGANKVHYGRCSSGL